MTQYYKNFETFYRVLALSAGCGPIPPVFNLFMSWRHHFVAVNARRDKWGKLNSLYNPRGF